MEIQDLWNILLNYSKISWVRSFSFDSVLIFNFQY